jgi:LysM repeat protein
MAAERPTEYVIDLGKIVQDRLDSFSSSRLKIQTNQEADFSRRVTDEGLTYSQQRDYYKAVLDKQNGMSFPDADYISSVKDKISSLTKLARFQKMNDQYTNDFNMYSTGKGSIDSAITDVQNMLSQTTDQSSRDSLQNTLTSLTQQKFKDDQQIIKNNISVATNDQSIPVLNTMMKDLQDLQTQAQLDGNNDVASNYAVQIDTIKSNISAIKVNQDTNAMNLQALTSGANSIQKLNMLSNLVGSADANTPVNISGTLYPSMKDYWSSQQNNYLAGQGSGLFKDFFGDLKSETNNKLSTLSSASPNGAISVSDMMNVNNMFGTLAQQSNIQPYINNLMAVKTDALSNVSTVTSNAILSEYNVNQGSPDAYKNALQKLTDLQTITGVNQASNINNLKEAETTSSASIYSKETQNPTETTLSPDQVTKLKENGYTDEEIGLIQAGSKPTPSNIKPTTEVPPVDTTVPKPTNITTTPSQNTTTQGNYTVKAGDTLESIYGANWKALSGYTGDPTKLPVGTVLPAPPTSTVNPNPTPAQNPKVTPTPPTTTATINKYTVAKGDTLSALAGKLKTTVADLVAKNKITDPNKIQVGQQLMY